MNRQWIKNGYPISPFSLPLEEQVFVRPIVRFKDFGAFLQIVFRMRGVSVLVDRMLKSHGIDPATISQLERLAIVGTSGMGALTYSPAWDIERESNISDLDELAASCQRILNHEDVRDLDTLFQMGGSSGGARPKVMTSEGSSNFQQRENIRIAD